jgi:hypothetical protein
MSELYRHHLVQFVRSVIDLSYVESTTTTPAFLVAIDPRDSNDSDTTSANTKENFLFNIKDFDCLMDRFIQIKC